MRITLSNLKSDTCVYVDNSVDLVDFLGFLKKTDSGIYGDVVWISEKDMGKSEKSTGTVNRISGQNMNKNRCN